MSVCLNQTDDERVAGLPLMCHCVVVRLCGISHAALGCRLRTLANAKQTASDGVIAGRAAAIAVTSWQPGTAHRSAHGEVGCLPRRRGSCCVDRDSSSRRLIAAMKRRSS